MAFLLWRLIRRCWHVNCEGMNVGNFFSFLFFSLSLSFHSLSFKSEAAFYNAVFFSFPS